MDICGKSDGRVPTMWDQLDAVPCGHPGYATRLRQPTYLGGVRLHDVHSTPVEEGNKGLSPG